MAALCCRTLARASSAAALEGSVTSSFSLLDLGLRTIGMLRGVTGAQPFAWWKARIASTWCLRWCDLTVALALSTARAVGGSRSRKLTGNMDTTSVGCVAVTVTECVFHLPAAHTSISPTQSPPPVVHKSITLRQRCLRGSCTMSDSERSTVRREHSMSTSTVTRHSPDTMKCTLFNSSPVRTMVCPASYDALVKKVDIGRRSLLTHCLNTGNNFCIHAILSERCRIWTALSART
mmetsp:Transcript_12884/g.29590  ORF Transcript_12884/g.29590 Transcript_12884/m.29590 type:complete len:235 (+) Transcript_12884:1387-2091(+)